MVTYALCNDRRTLLWFGNDRAQDFTIHTAAARLGARDPWTALMPRPQRLPADLLEEGHTIPIARVQAMHAGKRRARAQRG
jgi:bifunctional non-homologous end joining protein LigD